MRIALISDIHGNYPALVKVIEDAVSNKVDRFIFLGDYIFDLPYSNEVTRFLMKMNNSCIIKGNKETYLSKLINQDQNEWTYNQMENIYQTFRELSPDVLDFLIGLDEEYTVLLNSDISLFATHSLDVLKNSSNTHCSSINFHKKMLREPFSHQQFLSEFNELLKSDEYISCIDKINSDIIVFGHNHLQCFGYCRNKLVINPGSCGQPLDFNTSAAYSILEIYRQELNVIEKRVDYNIESVINHAKMSQLYKKSKIWSELVFLALKQGRDYYGMIFEITRRIASSKNENYAYSSNETWEEAYNILLSNLSK